MPTTLKLVKKVADGKWKAIGTFTDAFRPAITGPIEVLVQEVDPNSVQLILDSSLLISKILNRQVQNYWNVDPVPVKEKLKAGLEIELSKFVFALVPKKIIE